MLRRFFRLALLTALSAIPCFAQNTFVTSTLTATGSTCTPQNVNAATTYCALAALTTQDGSVGVVINGTFSATLQFEESADGGNTWTSANATAQPAAAGPVTSTTGTGAWVAPVSGMTHFRVRISSYSSGQALVSIWPGYGHPSTAVTPVSTVSTVNTSGPTSGGNACANPSAVMTSVVTATSGTAATQIIALSSGKQIFICSGYFGNGAGTSPTMSLQYGTGTNCASSPTTFYPLVVTPAGTAAPVQFPANFFATPASQAVCYTQGGTTPTATLVLTYAQQ